MRFTVTLELLIIASSVFAKSFSGKRNSHALDFTIPTSAATVKVQMLKALTATLPLSLFAAEDPNVATDANTDLIGSAFLLEHSSGRRVMFDIGIRKDTENLAPAILKTFANPDGSFPFKVEKDIPTQLKEGGIQLDTIDTVIWSHSHFDHIGDMSLFPNSTNVLAGPGTLKNTQPPFPENPNALNVNSDFEGRNVSEVVFDAPRIAGQGAHDFFGDGTMFLVDLPGHIAGHMGALVRVTTSPTTFILLAGDSNHHIGLVRPNPGVRLLCDHQHDLPQDLQKLGEPDFSDPFIAPAPQNKSIHTDAVAATVSLGKVQRFDARADTWVILSHDGSFAPFLNKTDGIPLFPGSLNDWRKKGLKELTKFAYLKSDNPANIFQNGTDTTGSATESSESGQNSTDSSTGTATAPAGSTATSSESSASATGGAAVDDENSGAEDATADSTAEDESAEDEDGSSDEEASDSQDSADSSV